MPDLSALTITVDPIEVKDDEVDTELQNLRAELSARRRRVEFSRRRLHRASPLE